jgi:hypothetical protein
MHIFHLYYQKVAGRSEKGLEKLALGFSDVCEGFFDILETVLDLVKLFA